MAGYYDPLLAVFDHMVEQGFLSEEHRKMVLVEDDPRSLLDAFAHCESPKTIKWIEETET